ncbi:MAG TPA: DUF4386 domain-containing protein [Actinomycetota bacterium]|nr:DUF4386 domain-containing protein [Actinomycetota bacterium]
MASRITDVSPRQAARIAGVGYLVIFVLAIFANFFARANLIESGDAAATTANIVDSEGLFRAGLVSFLVVFVVDVVIAWALYIVFRTVSRDVSLVTAWFRLVYTAFLGVGLTFFFVVLKLVSGAEYLGAFERGQVDAQVMLSLDAFNFTWLIGLVCFGIHLILLGYLVLRSGYISRILGILLIVAGAAYIVDTLAHALLANYEDYETVFLAIVAVPSVIAELSFALWLLVRGGKHPEVRQEAG